MSTIEDRLFTDAASHSTAATADWDGVVDRAARRVKRQHTVGRVAIGAFALLIIAAISFGQARTGTLDATDLAQPQLSADAEDLNEALFQESSPIGILAGWFLAWGGSAAVVGFAYFASPRDFREPFVVARGSRVLVAASSVILWNAALLLPTIALLRVIDWGILRSLRHEASFAFTVAIAAAGLFSAHVHKRTGQVVGHFLLFWLLVGVVGAIVPDVGATNDAFESLVAITAIVVVAGAAFYLRSRLGFRADFERLTLASLQTRTTRQKLSAGLIALGLLTSAIALAQPVVLQAHLVEAIPEVEGYSRQIAIRETLFTSGASPQVSVSLNPEEPSSSEQVSDLLRDLGFQPNFQGEDFEQLLRPRGDALAEIVARVNEDLTFGDLVAYRTGGSISLGGDNNNAFRDLRTIRNLGYAIVFAGMLLLWSESAIGRYLHGANAWTRRPKSQEWLGWAVVIAAAVIPFATSALTQGAFAVILAGLVWYVGARLLVPAPARSQPAEPQDSVTEPPSGNQRRRRPPD